MMHHLTMGVCPVRISATNPSGTGTPSVTIDTLPLSSGAATHLFYRLRAY